MKIKSVKISGFRAFEKEQDATFDFTSEGEIMNFASIYAPNGFGKTSFYDAVEFGITNKIQRFDKMVDFDNIRKENEPALILNNRSSSGKIHIVTTSNEYPRTVRKVYSSTSKLENKYFQNQFLSQDLIDSFLKEERAEDRYIKFLDIDENLKKYDGIYKKISILLQFIKDEKKILNVDKKDNEKSLQTEIDFEQEFKKFDEINEVISTLNVQGENIALIDQHTFNETAYDNLSRNIDVRLSSLEGELIKARLRIGTIVLARDGQKSEDNQLSGGVLFYLENRSKIQKLEEQIRESNQIIKLIEEKEKINNDYSLNIENLKVQQNKLERARSIEKQFETYLDIKKEIDILQKNISEFKEKSLRIESDKDSFEKEKNDLRIKLNEKKKSLEKNQSILSSIPNHDEQLKLISKTIFEIEKDIKDLSELVTEGENKLNDSKEILDQFGYYDSKINDDIELLLEFKFFKGHQDLINNYLTESKTIDRSKSKINDLQSKIDLQSKLNKQLRDFISEGLDLINKSQTSDCPLCNQSFGTFEKLSESILSNKLLDSQLKIYLEEKNDAEIELNKILAKLSREKEEIIKIFSSIKQSYFLNYKNIQNSVEKLVSDRKEKLENLKNNQSILNNINILLGDSKTFEELFAKVQNEISKTESEILEFSNQIKKNDKLLLEKGTLLKLTQENLVIFDSNLVKHEASKDYSGVRNFFITELNSNNFEKSILLEQISIIQVTINKLITEKDLLDKSLDDLNVKLSNYILKKDEYIKRVEFLKNTRDLALRIYENYENHIQSEFGIKLIEEDKTEIEKSFLDIIENQKKIEKQTETKIEKFKITRILNDACIKVAESKKVQERIEKIKASLKGLENAEGKLITEKKSLRVFLKETIEAYFYTTLINEIYKKIDPHPDYRSIEFECDFAETKPRLQIYTLSNNEKGEIVKSVPSLYFSTAQINILSLSIFLARALKTKDDEGNSVDCIFIDDPIQSMDSINILSFIDLFRGITLSLGKQLIVSTHEENFHLLLQKKIPKELFKSKFIEFETFGKVKSI